MGVDTVGGLGGAGEVWRSKFQGGSDPDLKKILEDFGAIQNFVQDPTKQSAYQKAIANLRDEIEAYLKNIPKDVPEDVRNALKKLPDILDKWNDRAMEFHNSLETIAKLKEMGAPQDQIKEMEAFRDQIWKEMEQGRESSTSNFFVIYDYYKNSFGPLV